MKNIFFLALSITLFACNPQRHLKYAEAFVSHIPPIQIIEHNPNPNPMVNDPMRYDHFLAETMVQSLTQNGIKTTLMPGGAKLSNPTQFLINVGMVMIEDNRNPIEHENPEFALKITLMGGYTTSTKKGKPVTNMSHIETTLTFEEMGQEQKKDPNADPIKSLIQKGINALSDKIAEDAAKHLKANR